MTQNGSAASFEHLLRKAGWSPPQKRLVIFRYDRRMLTARWFRRAHVHPPYEVVSWSEVHADELESVRTRQRLHAYIPNFLLPFDHGGSLDTAISVALRSDGELIGWLITERAAADTIRYTKLFIDGRVDANRRLGMTLIAEAIRRQARVMGLNSYVVCGVHAENKATIRLLERLQPESVRESRGACKVLLSDTSQPHITKPNESVSA